MIGNRLVLNGLNPKSRWCDKDHVMLLACFQLLVDFLEKERPQRMTDYKHDARHRKAWAEMQALYRYWKKEYPAQERALDKLRLRGLSAIHLGHKIADGTTRVVNMTARDRQLFKKVIDAEDRFQAREDEMLMRLIKVRKHLWC